MSDTTTAVDIARRYVVLLMLGLLLLGVVLAMVYGMKSMPSFVGADDFGDHVSALTHTDLAWIVLHAA